MEKSGHCKAKNKKQPSAKGKTAKKRKSDGPSCSMFIAELSRKMTARRREEVEPPQNIVQTIIDNITNALPIKISKRSPSMTITPVQIETLQTLSPELLPKDTISIPHPQPTEVQEVVMHNITGSTPLEISSFKMPKGMFGVRDAGQDEPTAPKTISPVHIETLQTSPELLLNDTISIPYLQPMEVQEVVMHDIIGSTPVENFSFKMPKMPVITSDVMKEVVERRRKLIMNDASTTTEREADVASEIAKHVETLRKISLIAEDFNQKTAKNLKEICDSVQEDLLKKLEEVQQEQKAAALAQVQLRKIQEEEMAANQEE